MILILLQEAEQNHLLIYRSINDDNFKSVIVFNREEEEVVGGGSYYERDHCIILSQMAFKADYTNLGL